MKKLFWLPALFVILSLSLYTPALLAMASQPKEEAPTAVEEQKEEVAAPAETHEHAGTTAEPTKEHGGS